MQNDYLSVLLEALAVVAAAGACLLSFKEHLYAVQPSTLLSLYLLAHLAGQLVLLTAPTIISKAGRKHELGIGCVVVGVFFLVLENLDKKSILRKPYQQCAPEETTGILGRTFFWWINPILRDGNRSILVAEELPSIDEKLSSGALRKGIIQAWSKRRLCPTVLSNEKFRLTEDQANLTGKGRYLLSCYVSWPARSYLLFCLAWW